MGFFDILKQLIGLVPQVIGAGKAVVDAVTPKPRGPIAIPFGRKHIWEEYEPGREIRLLPVPICTYCGIKKTKANELSICSGPGAKNVS